MRKIKGLIAICLSFIMPLSLISMTSTADNTDYLTYEQKTSIIEALNYIEPQKSIVGLEGTNFSLLNIGKPIQTYNYINNQFVESRVMYPISENNKLVAFAISNDDLLNPRFQITMGLVKEINNTVTSNMPFALVYDKIGCYIYTSDRFTILKETHINDIKRSILKPNDTEMKNLDLNLTEINECNALGYKSDLNTKGIYYECPVKFVSQNPPSSLCWAGTIASIVNYCNGSSLSAVSVAQGYYGTSDYDRGINDSEVPSVFSNYRLYYTYKNQRPSENVILNNILNDYPVYGSFTWSNGRHAGVVYGINSIGGYIYIMDPEFGFTSASVSSSGYTYVSSYSNVTLTLDRAVCNNW